VLSGQDAGKRGWIESVEEREPGVASVSAPVRDGHGEVIAAVSISGPVQRTTRTPGKRYGAAVARAARGVSGA
jgi:DNA-binding IclR family transcriptional regulator